MEKTPRLRYVPQQEAPAQPASRWKKDRVFTLEDLREAAPDNLADASDERLVIELAADTGRDAFQLAKYFGVQTGASKGDFSAGISAGIDQLQGLGYSALAGASDALGIDSAAEYLRGQAEDQQYQGYLAGKPERERVEDITGVGSAIDWAQYQLGKNIPTMAGIAAASLIPGGQFTAPARLLATAPRALGGAGLRSGLPFAARREIVRQGRTGLSGQGALGQGAAAMKQLGAGTTVGYGSLYEASGADGEYNPYAALLGAPVYGAMEAAVPAALRGAVRGTGAPSAVRSVRGGVGRGLAGGAVTEAATEAGQTSMEMAYDGTMTPEEMQSQYLNAIAAGGVVGGAFGGVGGVFEGIRGKRAQEAADRLREMEENGDGSTNLTGMNDQVVPDEPGIDPEPVPATETQNEESQSAAPSTETAETVSNEGDAEPVVDAPSNIMTGVEFVENNTDAQEGTPLAELVRLSSPENSPITLGQYRGFKGAVTKARNRRERVTDEKELAELDAQIAEREEKLRAFEETRQAQEQVQQVRDALSRVRIVDSETGVSASPAQDFTEQDAELIAAYAPQVYSLLEERARSTAVDPAVRGEVDLAEQAQAELEFEPVDARDTSIQLFTDEALEQMRLETRSPKSRSTEAQLSTDDFLNLAEKLEAPVKSKQTGVQSAEKFDDVPYLIVENNGDGTATVVGHEGRHRAMEIARRGGKSMPVRITFAETGKGEAIRWGEYKGEMPTTLIGQDGNFSMPMPQSVTFPRQDTQTAAEVDVTAQPDVVQETEQVAQTVEQGPTFDPETELQVETLEAFINAYASQDRGGVELTDEREYLDMLDSVGAIGQGRLDAKVRGQRATQAGIVQLPRDVIAGIAIMLRRGDVTPEPIVFNTNTLSRNKAKTEEYAQQMLAIHDAIMNAAVEAQKLYSIENQIANLGYDAEQLGKTVSDYNAANSQLAIMHSLATGEKLATPTNVTKKQADTASKRLKAIGRFERAKEGEILATYREQLAVVKQAMQEAEAAAGNLNTLRAVVGAFKTRNQKGNEKGEIRSNLSRPSYYRDKVEMLGKTAGGKKGINTLDDYVTTVDSVFSPMLVRYEQGALDPENSAYANTLETRRSRELEANKSKRINPKLYEANRKDGLLGIVDYVTNSLGANSAYTQVLGKFLVRTLKQMREKGVLPDVVLEADGQPSYNPNTNTITLTTLESQEIILHEALHGALQWYVSNNPNDPSVVELTQTVEEILKYDDAAIDALPGLSATYKTAAKDAVQAIREVYATGATTDAVLELISYGTTLMGFQRMLQGIGQDPSPTVATWQATVKELWGRIVDLIAEFLNFGTKTNSNAAANVLGNTLRLLDESYDSFLTTAAEDISIEGRQLDHSIYNDNYLNGDEAPTDPESNYLSQKATEYSKKGERGWLVSSRILFEKIGWNKMFGRELQDGTFEPGKFQEFMKEFMEKIRNNSPNLTRFITLFNTKFGLTPTVGQILERYKADRSGVFMLHDGFLARLDRMDINEVRAVMIYLDNNDSRPLMKEFSKVKAEEIIETADLMKQEFERLITFLPKSVQASFDLQNRKFTEILLDVNNKDAVSSHKITVAGLRKQVNAAENSTSEVDFNNFEAELADIDPDTNEADLSGEFYRISVDYGRAEPVTMFISKERFDSDYDTDLDALGQALGGKVHPVNTAAVYTYVGKGKSGADGDAKMRFKHKMTYADAMSEKAKRDFILSARNTLGGLNNHYASTRLINNLVRAGRDGMFEMFDTIDDLNAYSVQNGGPMFDVENIPSGADVLKSSAAVWEGRARGRYIRVPEDENWGDLGGKIISSQVWIAMNDTTDRQPLWNSRVWGRTMTGWKATKTVLNPGTQITNVVSNVILAMFHGVPLANVRDAAKIIALYQRAPEKLRKQDRDLVRAFIASGGQIGNFANAELQQVYSDSTAKAMEPGRGDESVLTRFTGMMETQRLINKHVADKVERAGGTAADKAKAGYAMMEDFYNMGDNIFRFAAFMTRTGDIMKTNGEKVPSENTLMMAANYAKKAFVDYDIDSPFVKMARQTFFPFISYTYGIIPVLARIVATKPWLIANTMAVMALADLATAALAGDDDDELRRLGPKDMEDRIFGFGPRMHLRLPFFGEDDEPVYLRWGDYVPFASSIRGGLPNSFMGIENWPAGLTPGNPFLSVFTAAVGFNVFTGQRTFKETNTGFENVMTVFRETYNTATPPFMSAYNKDRLFDLIDQVQGPTGRDPSAAMFLGARILGLKLVDYNTGEEEYFRQLRSSQVMRDYKAAIRQAVREESRTGSPDYEALDERLADLHERMLEEYNKVYKIEE